MKILFYPLKSNAQGDYLELTIIHGMRELLKKILLNILEKILCTVILQSLQNLNFMDKIFIIKKPNRGC